jgi:hypothetical protein
MLGVLSPYSALRPYTRELYPFFEITDFNMSLSRLRSATSFLNHFLAQRSQFLGLVHFHAAELRVPGADRVYGNARLPSHLGRRPSASSCFSRPMICSVFHFRFDISIPLPFVRNHTSFGVNPGDQVSLTPQKAWAHGVVVQFYKYSSPMEERETSVFIHLIVKVAVPLSM